MKVRVLLASCLLSWPFAASSGADGMLDDPFSTTRHVSQSPGKNHLALEDPCRLNKDTDHAWTMVDVIDQALCSNPQTRQAWANARFQAGQVGIAKSAYLPTVTLNTSVSRSMNSASSGDDLVGRKLHRRSGGHRLRLFLQPIQ
ncbi:MAG: TolC family protein [Methylobacter tundripaludum]|nr:TolC family protein [Methylobacter tundripaludum]